MSGLAFDQGLLNRDSGGLRRHHFQRDSTRREDGGNADGPWRVMGEGPYHCHHHGHSRNNPSSNATHGLGF